MNNSQIDYIIDKYAGLILRDFNIVAIGRGRKIINNISTGIPSLTFLVKKKLSKGELSKFNIIPEFIGNIATDVIESGEIVQCGPQQRLRPACGGLSIGIKRDSNKYTTTIGCAVTEKDKRENMYILTNNHVLTGWGKWDEGSEWPVYQPSLEYGGNASKDDKIGILCKAYPMNMGENIKDAREYNEIDAAIIKVGPLNDETKRDKLATNFIGDIKLSGVIRAEKDSKEIANGLPINMMGAINNTFGTIMLLNVVCEGTSSLGNFKILYRDQIACSIKAESGDSGALGYIRKSGKIYAVGLFWGASEVSNVHGNKTRYGMFCKISKVLDLLDLELLL